MKPYIMICGWNRKPIKPEGAGKLSPALLTERGRLMIHIRAAFIMLYFLAMGAGAVCLYDFLANIFLRVKF